MMAAFTIKALLWEQSNVEDLRPLLPNLCESFLRLMKCMEHEWLVSCLRRLAETYDTEIIPYAAIIVRELTGMIITYLDQAANDREEREDDDGAQTALETLGTLDRVLQSLCQQQAVMDGLLPLILQVVSKSEHMAW